MPTEAAVKAEETLIHVLWINAGLSCDGDSVALTAATQPSIEEIALGALPGPAEGRRALAAHRFRVRTQRRRRRLPRVVLQGRPRRARAVRAGRRGLDPQREDQRRGLLGGVRQRPGDRPADHHQRVDRPARAQGAPRWSRSAPAPPTAASTRWRATRPARMGARRLPRLGLEVARPACRSSTCPGCPVQPDNFMETLLYLLYQAAGQAPMIPLDDAAAAAPGCSARPCTRAATAPATTSRATSPPSTARPSAIVKLGCWGPVVNCNVPKRGWMDGIGGCPNVGGICIGCTMPGFPDKFMPFMDEPPGRQARRPLHRGSTAADPQRCAASPTARVDKEPKWRHNGHGAHHRLRPDWSHLAADPRQSQGGHTR